MRLRLPAPAKLNLFLHIVGRRADGYHLLQTAFQFIDLCDELEFRRIDSPGCELRGDDCGVAPADNLVLRAARLLAEHCAVQHGAEIVLRKRIPIGGGLGGGSSDAATTLLALNSLWGCELELEQLAQLGASLGADLPVFLRGEASWAEGTGEQLQALTSLEQPWYLVLRPGCAVNTAAIFKRPELTRNSPPITISAFLRQGGLNDCEPVVRHLYPEVDQAIEWLEQFTPARLTGTGSCVFGSFPSADSARRALAAMPTKRWTGFVARGLNRSPAHLALYD